MTVTIERAVTLQKELNYIPSWLTWVGSTTSCLNYLGIECDTADVAGATGYAFTFNVHKSLCPSGPTAFDWNKLNNGVNILGRSTLAFVSSECHCAQAEKTDGTRAHCKEAYDLASRELTEGRPVVLWGAYLPEFAVVTGVEDGKFIVKSINGHCGKEEPPIPYEDLEAPGGPYLLGFPTPTGLRGKNWTKALMLRQACILLEEDNAWPGYSSGLSAYETWIELLEAGPDKPPFEKYTPFGNAYNAQCWSETKRLAYKFLDKFGRENELVAVPVKKAAKAYKKVAEAMETVAKLFPFPPKEEIMSEQVRTDAIASLKDAESSEKKAFKQLKKACEIEWPK